jgi:hypothetical protein
LNYVDVKNRRKINLQFSNEDDISSILSTLEYVELLSTIDNVDESIVDVVDGEAMVDDDDWFVNDFVVVVVGIVDVVEGFVVVNIDIKIVGSVVIDIDDVSAIVGLSTVV